MMENQQKSVDFVWVANRTIRADIISNKRFFRMLLKFALFFFIVCYASRMLPDAYQTFTYTPEKWEQVDVLEVHDVSSLNRFLRVYAAPANTSEDMDLVHQVEVFGLVDDEQKQKRMSVTVTDMNDFVDISDKQLKFFFGDLHILEDVAYRVKVHKPLKLGRLLQNENDNRKNENLPSTTQQNSTISAQTQSNATDEETIEEEEKRKAEQEEKKKREEQEKKKQQQEKRKQQQEKKKQEERKRQQEQEKKKQQEEAKRRQEEQAKKEEQRKKDEQIRRKEQEERQRLYDHTNIRIEVQQMSSFSTVLQLFIRYISMLMIIYVASDNTDAPRSIPIICVITSNPLLFLQISYPNRVSDAIDCLCRSGPLLYFPVWLFYIHTKIKFPDQAKHKLFLFIKIGLGLTLYIVNTLRLLHFHVFALETLIGAVLILLVGMYLWEAFLDLQHQYHRDKVLVVTTLAYLASLFTFKILIGPYRDIMLYIIHQSYGLFIIYLMGSPKSPRNKAKKIAPTESDKIHTSNEVVITQKC